MKQFTWVCIFSLLILLFGATVYMIFLSEPVQPRLDYYSIDSNYVTVVGTVDHLSYYDSKALFLAFEDKTVAFQDSTFVIEGKNLETILKNGFEEKVTLGTQVEFVSAVRVFWDGYEMPIVALSVNGEVLLPFEEGKQNLLEMIAG